jgi:hypothetical protein
MQKSAQKNFSNQARPLSTFIPPSSPPFPLCKTSFSPSVPYYLLNLFICNVFPLSSSVSPSPSVISVFYLPSPFHLPPLSISLLRPSCSSSYFSSTTPSPPVHVSVSMAPCSLLPFLSRSPCLRLPSFFPVPEFFFLVPFLSCLTAIVYRNLSTFLSFPFTASLPAS